LNSGRFQLARLFLQIPGNDEQRIVPQIAVASKTDEDSDSRAEPSDDDSHRAPYQDNHQDRQDHTTGNGQELGGSVRRTHDTPLAASTFPQPGSGAGLSRAACSLVDRLKKLVRCLR